MWEVIFDIPCMLGASFRDRGSACMTRGGYSSPVLL